MILTQGRSLWSDTMPLSDFEKRRIAKILTAYADKRIPKHLRRQTDMGFTIRDTAVTLFER